jgi:hypothetical protein
VRHETPAGSAQAPQGIRPLSVAMVGNPGSGADRAAVATKPNAPTATARRLGGRG